MNYQEELKMLFKTQENELQRLQSVLEQYKITATNQMLEIKRLSKLNEALATENGQLLDLGNRLKITSESALKNNELLEKQSRASTIVLNKQKEQIESLEQQLKRLIKK